MSQLTRPRFPSPVLRSTQAPLKKEHVEGICPGEGTRIVTLSLLAGGPARGSRTCLAGGTCPEPRWPSAELRDGAMLSLHENQFLFQVVLAGAFYPNYFTFGQPDEEVAVRELAGKDPRTTVMVGGEGQGLGAARPRGWLRSSLLGPLSPSVSVLSGLCP